MSKITLTNLVNLQNETTAVNAVNANNATLTTALDNTLSRDGTTPNTMGASLDMNSFNIYNLPSPATVNSPARLVDVMTNPTITVPAVGTSGAVVGLLNTNLTFSGNNTFSGTTTLSSALTYGGVTLNNVVTGTGNMVLSGSPTIVTPVIGTINGLLNLNGSSGNLSINASTGGNVLLTVASGASTLVYGGSNLYPGTDDTVILGIASTNRFKQLFLGATASTSTTTGALVVSGGVGIGGAANLKGPVIVTPAVSGAPATSGTAQAGLIQRFATNPAGSLQNVLDIGGYGTGSFGIWLQVGNQTALGGASALPLILQPAIASIGGGVSIGKATNSYTLDVAGDIISTSPTKGMGYGTGAGGAVTQATNKTTAVTLNTISGQITMNNASLVNNGLALFQLTNSNIAATDMLLVSLQTPVTSNAYRVWVNSISAGSATIILTQTSGSTLSDAVVLNFMVIKGVAS